MTSNITTMTFRALDQVDPDVANLIRKEFKRQSETLERQHSEMIFQKRDGMVGSEYPVIERSFRISLGATVRRVPMPKPR